MSPTLKKFLITSGLAAFVVIFSSVVIARLGKTDATTPVVTDGTPSAAASNTNKANDATTPASATPTTPPTTTPTTDAPKNNTPSAATIAPQEQAATAPIGLFTARVPAGSVAATTPIAIGSLDPTAAPFRVTFAPYGAGIEEIVFADFWTTVGSARDARRARAANDPALMPADSKRHVLDKARTVGKTIVPVLSALGIEIDGAFVSLIGPVWAQDASSPGIFRTEVVATDGTPWLTITRSFVGPSTDYHFALQHEIKNLTNRAVSVRFAQCGPSDLGRDATSMTEVRRFHFGYLFPPERDPSQSFVTAHGQMFERDAIIGKIGENDHVMWPDLTAKDGKYNLSWYGTTDRYFTLAVHAPFAPPTNASRILTSVSEVRAYSNGLASPLDELRAELWSPVVVVAAGASTALDFGIFAGPLDPKLLDRTEPYLGLNMGDLIVYLMSGCCSWCTFAWLADGMLWFLSFLHDYVVFDWGLAIIALVVVVRTVLHPVQKKSQISMQRFSRAMAAMKPELDQLQKKFKDEPARMQQEQMRMFRERGVSPAGCVGGLLPTFAQMPIWMALYAVLYFAFPLRQQAPFFGIFQSFGDWTFLADLSAPDQFFQLGTPINLFLFTLTSINLLPVLMGVVFYFQQKYMAPPVTPNMTDEQIQQQKMMKWMMVFLFPVMTYTVPSGLTLYILTSTCVGIVEGRAIKKQVDAMDFSVKPGAAPKKKDFLGRLYEQALSRAQERGAKAKKFKDR